MLGSQAQHDANKTSGTVQDYAEHKNSADDATETSSAVQDYARPTSSAQDAIGIN